MEHPIPPRELLSSWTQAIAPVLGVVLWCTGCRPVGVAGTNLEMDGGQLDLLANGEAGERRERMLAAVDSIRSRHGFGAIQRASSRDPSRGAWG